MIQLDRRISLSGAIQFGVLLFAVISGYVRLQAEQDKLREAFTAHLKQSDQIHEDLVRKDVNTESLGSMMRQLQRIETDIKEIKESLR
jgi:hypothetical protein